MQQKRPVCGHCGEHGAVFGQQKELREDLLGYCQSLCFRRLRTGWPLEQPLLSWRALTLSAGSSGCPGMGISISTA